MDLVGWLLVLLTTMRLARLVIVDSLGKWWVQDPVDRAMARYERREVTAAREAGRPPRTPWWWKYRSGLWCPWCIGFWIAVAVLGSYLWVGQTWPWRFVAGALSLNYVAAQIGSRWDTSKEGMDD